MRKSQRASNSYVRDYDTAEYNRATWKEYDIGQCFKGWKDRGFPRVLVLSRTNGYRMVRSVQFSFVLVERKVVWTSVFVSFVIIVLLWYTECLVVRRVLFFFHISTNFCAMPSLGALTSNGMILKSLEVLLYHFSSMIFSEDNYIGVPSPWFRTVVHLSLQSIGAE